MCLPPQQVVELDTSGFLLIILKTDANTEAATVSEVLWLD